MIANFISKLLPAKAVPAAVCVIPFRVVFVSPFFELEVDPGNGWHIVHSQIPQVISDGAATVFPVLRFNSFGDAFDYATKKLGMTNMRERSYFGLYKSPPASYEKDAKPRIVETQYVSEGRTLTAQQVPNAHKVEPFTVYSSDAEKSAA